MLFYSMIFTTFALRAIRACDPRNFYHELASPCELDKSQLSFDLRIRYFSNNTEVDFAFISVSLNR